MHPHLPSRLSALDLPILLFLLSAALGVLPAYDRSLSWAPLAVMLAGGGLYLLVSRASVSERWALRLARGLVIASGVVAFIFITQAGGYQSDDKVEVIARAAGWIGGLFPQVGIWQPFPNSAATFLEGLLFLAVGLFFSEKAKGWRIAAGAMVGLIGLALVFSQSRGAWLAVAVAGLLWLALYNRPARWAALGLGAVMVALLAAVIASRDIGVLARIPLVDRTVAPLFIRPDRLDVYQGSMALIQDMPYTGVGLGGQFAMQYSRYVLMIEVPFLTYSHNLYLETWLELGLLGVFCLAWLVASLYWKSTHWRIPRNSRLYEGAVAGFTAFLVHGLTDARPFVDTWCWLPFFILLGLAAGAEMGVPVAASPKWRAYVPLSAALGVLGVLFVIVPLHAGAWQANLGSLRQSWVELRPGLSQPERDSLAIQAETRLRRSIAMSPDQRTAHLRLGMLLSQLRRFDEANVELDEACEAAPENATAIKALGLGYVWTGELEKAQPLLEQVDGVVRELNTWGWWWGENGRKDLSINAYRASLMLYPDQPAVREVLDGLEIEP